MLPHNHFLIAAIAISISSAFFSKSLPEVIIWIIVGGFVSAMVDVDVVAITYWKSRKNEGLKTFRNPVELFRNYSLFIDTITETGILKMGMVTHMVISILFILLFYVFWSEYFVPVLVGITTHILSDIPNIRRLT